MAKRSLVLVVFLITTVFVTSCASASLKQGLSGSQDIAESIESERFVRESEMPAAAPRESAAGGVTSIDDGLDSASGRLIIRNVSLSVVVEDTDDVLGEIRDLVKGYEGYVADSRRWLVNDQPHASVTIRVPAASLDQVLDVLRGLAIRVEDENVSGQDVTEEYYDLQARLRNLEATEKELLALLTEVRENRGKADEILAIHRELTNIRSQIESLKGRKEYLERMSALATISLEIRPKESPRTVVEKARWNPIVTISKGLRAFVEAFQAIADLAIYLLIFSPFIIVPVGVVWLLARLIRRRKGKRSGK